MTVTIHQPEHLPWLGLFNKIAKAELFVILDSVQYEKNYFLLRDIQSIVKVKYAHNSFYDIFAAHADHGPLCGDGVGAFALLLAEISAFFCAGHFYGGLYIPSAI